jgi:hypothetical protein
VACVVRPATEREGRGGGVKGSCLPPTGAKDMAKLNQYEKKLATNLLTPGVWVRLGYTPLYLPIPPPPRAASWLAMK